MIAVDTNILVYAHRGDSSFHQRSRAAVRELAESPAPWALPWPCIHEFLSIVTHPRIFDPPTPAAEALDQVEAWLESPSLRLLSEGRGYWPGLRALVEPGSIRGPKVHDGRILALCAQSGVRELWSADRDFSRFATGLRIVNPILETPSSS